MSRLARSAALRAALLLAAAMGGLAGPPREAALAAEDFTRIEAALAEERAKLAKVWLDLSRDLAARDLKAAALDAVARARAIHPEASGLDEAARRAEALAGNGTPDADSARRVEKARKEAAKGYDRMAAVLRKETQDSRYTEFLVEALGLEATKARVKVLSDMAQKEPVLLRSPRHPFAALVSLPRAWKPGAEWPVLVCVEGESIFFPGHMNRFRDERGDRAWILVCPFTLSSAEEILLDRYRAYPEALVRDWNGRRLQFDEEGLLSLLGFLAEHFGASRRVTLTAVGKGGPFAYRMLLRRPASVEAAALACARFDAAVAEGAEKAAGGGPPVLLLTASADPDREAIRGRERPGVEAMTDAAAQALAKQGFANLERRLLPGARTEAAAEVWAWLDGLFPAR